MRAPVHRDRLRMLALVGFLLSPLAARAEEISTPAAVQAATPIPAPVTSPPPEPGAVMPVPPPAGTPVVIAPPPAAPEEPLKPNPSAISTAFGLRAAGRIQGANDPSKFNDVSMDTIYLEARFSGTLDKYFGWQANFNGSAMPASTSGSASIMDLVLKLDVADEFHIWGGRLLVPSDRSNFSGPFFMSPWNYPGVFGSKGFIGPKTGATGRDDGIVVWGNILEGKVKYFAGAFNLDNAATSPLYSARINIALLGTEPGFWGSSTYYGTKDIVAIGGGYQYQKDGSGTKTAPATLNNVMADLLAEKNVGGGTVSLEGAYYHFDSGAPAKQAFYVLASFLTADYFGVGRLQPLFRWQQASPQDGGASWKVLDAFVTYVIHGYNLKIAAGYQRIDDGTSSKSNAIQVGVQMQE